MGKKRTESGLGELKKQNEYQQSREDQLANLGPYNKKLLIDRLKTDNVSLQYLITYLLTQYASGKIKVQK